MTSTITYEGAANENRLQNPPDDAISCVRFNPSIVSNHLLVSSWDTTVRIYSCSMAISSIRHQILYQHDTPVLSCSFMGENTASSGALDGSVKVYDLVKGQERQLGTHLKAVRVQDYCDEAQVLSTGSWDGDVKQWDVRTNGAVSIMSNGERVYAMSQCGTLIIVGLATRKVLVWDVRQPSAPLQNRESALKYQTRCIRAFPDQSGYVLSSIEGRVAVEYLHDNERNKKYAFKCHRLKDEAGEETIYPVNAVAFHPTYSTFATGGSDAIVNMWDPFNKKRLCQFHKYMTSVSSMDFSPDGNILAIATSYQNEKLEDPIPRPQDEIYIRRVTDAEVKPKSVVPA